MGWFLSGPGGRAGAGAIPGAGSLRADSAGRGVCGVAAATWQTQRVEDVHAFAGHIAYDSASRSELVVPLIKAERLIGVLDLDSPQLSRFSAADQAGIEGLVAILLRLSDC
ncbi:GAF domain-containing protein [Pseudomonas sp. sp1636]|uniref:GAF domain-containing protein n=1 Tax=Pseudomonas sp. sp1636 TaxID=3036707 RepID=UPI0025A4D73D|nr:GAF domain-containing protein [Pseudomonas sp. sp1636]MDM8347913.1 GAF domain-containing protein [Pseudomonas sp. sp1636]